MTPTSTAPAPLTLVDVRTRLRDLADRAVALVADRRHGLVAFSLVRIAYGVILLVDLVVNLPVRHRIWGPDAAYSLERLRADGGDGSILSLYLFARTAWQTDLIYLALAVAAALFALGWRTRVVTPVLFVLLWSWHERNPFVTNGGDNIMRILLLYMCVAHVSAYLSLDARRARREARTDRYDALAAHRATRRQLATILHNAALVACVGQLCVLYGASGLFKAQGEVWQEGTAVYYILRVADYSPWPELSQAVYTVPLLVTLATYAAVVVQIAFPFLLLRPVGRHVAFVVLVGMHLSIGFLMGLPVFSAFMIASDLLVFTDRELLGLRERVRVQVAHLRRSAARDPGTARPEPTPARVPVGALTTETA